MLESENRRLRGIIERNKARYVATVNRATKLEQESLVLKAENERLKAQGRSFYEQLIGNRDSLLSNLFGE